MEKIYLYYKNKRYDLDNLNQCIDFVNDLDYEDVIRFFNEYGDNFPILRPMDVKMIFTRKAVNMENIKVETLYRCERCGNCFTENETIKVKSTYRTVYVCKNCINSGVYTKCEHCGDYIDTSIKRSIRIYGTENYLEMCTQCMLRNEEYVIKNCDCCRKLIAFPKSMDTSEYIIDGFTLCEKHNNLRRCEQCSNWYDKEELVDGVCQECREYNRKKEKLKDYGYKPTPIFKMSSKDTTLPLFLGLELETEIVDCDISQVDVADTGTTYSSDFMYAKTDGSLDHGVEFVTHPISFRAWNETYFKRLENEVLNELDGLCEKRPSGAGIHIHVNRDKLTDRDITKICYMLSKPKNYNLLTEFSRRYYEDIKRWAGRYSTYDYSTWENLRELIDLSDSSRYRVVNIQPRKTIEFRCFSSSLDIDDIKAYIYFVYNTVAYAKNHTEQECYNATFKDLMLYRNKTFMNKYLEKRGDLECVL